MSDLAEVLAAVEGRVGYLRALTSVPGDPGWVACGSVDADVLDAALVGSKAGDDRVVATSLLVQSYAFRVAAVSVAAYAVGLAWPRPGAATMAVRLGSGRASAVAYLDDDLGEPGDVESLAAFVEQHLEPVVQAAHATTRLGARLLEGNTAASLAAAFRSVEGAAADRGDLAERDAVRASASRYPGLDGTSGAFAVEGDRWVWQRHSCCLWYRASQRTCEDCSLKRSAA